MCVETVLVMTLVFVKILRDVENICSTDYSGEE